MDTRVDPELITNVRSLLALRRGDVTEDLVFTERVDIRLDGHANGPFVVGKRAMTFVVDEPPERAGRDTAPNPLAFFLGGAATCYLSHFMMLALEAGAPIDELTTSVRGRFDRRAIGGHLQRVVYDVAVSSPAEGPAIEEVARTAEKMCFAHNTLVKAGVDIMTRVVLNGGTLVELVADTTHMDSA